MTCNRRAVELLGILTGYYKEKGVDLNKVQGSVAYDAFKVPLVKGIALESDWVEDVVDVLKAGEALPHYRVLAVQASNLSDAGSYIT